MNILLIIVILGIIEGLTEFIPVSSTGHLILFGHLLGYDGAEAKTFQIFIQSGAILAVVVVYFRRFFELLVVPADTSFHSRKGLGLVILSTLPILIVGLLGHGIIKEHLMTSANVAIGLAAGGVWILVMEHFFQPSERRKLDDLDWRTALGIGLIQCLALWPGVSRAASTILGAMMLGMRRKDAAEYSFFIAVPALLAACGYDLVKSLPHLTASALPHFALGFIVAFISALLAIKFFIRYVSQHTLAVFGWYRLILAAAVFFALR